jgi:carotenoid 1,2-hydratase
VAPGAYLWWYLDALSDDGRHALTIIAFVGSVFSPYYAWAQQRAAARGTPLAAENFCAINVALYGPGARRWTMTERGERHVRRSASEFVVGPSRLHWDGTALQFDLDEWANPLPRRVRGRVRVVPQGLTGFRAALDEGGRHRWGPIAPCARVELDLMHPALRWQGHGYLDSNEGDEPIDRPFTDWDWSRATLADGSTAVIYDVRQKDGLERVIARRFRPDGRSEPFEAPPRQHLPASAWRVARRMRTEHGVPGGAGGVGTPTARVHETLEDTPFYVRSVLRSRLLGQEVTSVHESIDMPRLVSMPVRFMLPWRMPRRG